MSLGWKITLAIILIVGTSLGLYFYYIAPKYQAKEETTIIVKRIPGTTKGTSTTSGDFKEALKQWQKDSQDIDDFSKSTMINEITGDLNKF